MSASVIFFMGVVQFKVAFESNEETVLCVQKEFQKNKWRESWSFSVREKSF